MSEKIYEIETRIIEYHQLSVEADTEQEAIEKASELGYDTHGAYRTDVKVDSVKILAD